MVRNNKRIKAFKWYCQHLHSHPWHVYLILFALLRDVIERVHPGTIGKSNLGGVNHLHLDRQKQSQPWRYFREQK